MHAPVLSTRGNNTFSYENTLTLGQEDGSSMYNIVDMHHFPEHVRTSSEKILTLREENVSSGLPMPIHSTFVLCPS